MTGICALISDCILALEIPCYRCLARVDGAFWVHDAKVCMIKVRSNVL